MGRKKSVTKKGRDTVKIERKAVKTPLKFDSINIGIPGLSLKLKAGNETFDESLVAEINETADLQDLLKSMDIVRARKNVLQTTRDNSKKKIARLKKERTIIIQQLFTELSENEKASLKKKRKQVQDDLTNAVNERNQAQSDLTDLNRIHTEISRVSKKVSKRRGEALANIEED